MLFHNSSMNSCALSGVVTADSLLQRQTQRLAARALSRTPRLCSIRDLSFAPDVEALGVPIGHRTSREPTATAFPTPKCRRVLLSPE
jgi:hypothetical protein